jgi:RimJ/RimL family protein N-acetyltransferase
MHADGPFTIDHPLLARLPIAAGAVCLHAFRADDVDHFLASRSDPEVARYRGAPPLWREGEWARIGSIAHAAGDRLVRDIGLLREGPARVQTGLSLARGAQGRGRALAAVRACMVGLLVPLGMTRRRGITDARNTASLRLLSGYADFMAGIDALVMGRKTFETVLGFDPGPCQDRQKAPLGALCVSDRLRHAAPPHWARGVPSPRGLALAINPRP